MELWNINTEWGRCYFLVSNKKVTKEVDQRGATKMRPLWNPPPHRRSVRKNVPIFAHLRLKSQKITSRKTTENRDIFGGRMAMRREGYIGEGGAPRSESKLL